MNGKGMQEGNFEDEDDDEHEKVCKKNVSS
jgi:hypothetical protein